MKSAVLPDLVCRACGRRYELAAAAWRCRCGSVLDVADFQMPSLSLGGLAGRPWSMWRYAEALPVPFDPEVTMGEGLTPLVPAPGRPGCWLKLEFLMPTLSFKDRGAVILAMVAKLTGAPSVVIDSSGNAGTALAAYAARVQVPCEVFVPAGTSPGKLHQMRAHGADVHVVGGDRQAAADAAMARLSERPGARYASHVYDPYFLHGTKTYAYEIWEQTSGRPPHTMLLPVGNGTLLLGAHIGFCELVAQGALSSMPRLVGVQAAGCAPLGVAFSRGLPAPAPVEVLPTVAEGIAIARPARGAQVLEAVAATGGEIVTVDEARIEAAQADLAAKGFFVEPTAAVCWAALLRGGYEDAVVPLGGAGLKSVH